MLNICCLVTDFYAYLCTAEHNFETYKTDTVKSQFKEQNCANIKSRLDIVYFGPKIHNVLIEVLELTITILNFLKYPKNATNVVER